MSQYKQQCHCGHDIASHYKDLDMEEPARMGCLARGCECKKYLNEWEPKPTVKAPPAAEKFEEEEVKTDPVWPTPQLTFPWASPGWKPGGP